MKRTALAVIACSVVGVSTVWAHSGYMTPFNTRYSASTLSARMAAATGSNCNVCHHPTDRADSGNCYKDAIANRINAGRTIAQALADVEALDSDNDGVNNVTEIMMARTDLPGTQVGYSPGLIGATGTDPCGAAGNVTSQRETPLPTGPTCDSVDFNGDGLFPDTQDIADFLTVFGGGACPTGACGDIDFNNDGLFPDTSDITVFLSVFGGGVCE